MSEIIRASTARRLADIAPERGIGLDFDVFASEIQSKSRAGLYSCRILMGIEDVPKYQPQADLLRELGYRVDFDPPKGFVEGRTAMNISWEGTPDV